MSQLVRTRFAPSPTGHMHVGGLRTALFAWLVARQAGGQFILRIEDTDQAREVAGSVDHIIDSLAWLGLAHDEGPIYQSERVRDGLYQKWAQRLIDAGRAYADPYSTVELQALREQARADQQPFLFRNHRPKNPEAWDGSTPLRFKSEPKAYTTDDLVMGTLATGPEVVDDFILIKSDGYPTYNFAHIVDDCETHITHVIRGQEFVSSLPNYRNLYEALDEAPPQFATVPHILGTTGNKKLSKRDGAKDILDYRTEGYLPDAMLNFLATLGWNDGSEQELFTATELIEKFDLTRVQKGGARFDEQRLLWLNGAHIRRLELDDLYQKVEAFWPEQAATHPKAYKRQVLSLVQERLKFFAELPDLTRFFFAEPAVDPELIATHKQLRKFELSELKQLLQTVRDNLEQSDFSPEDVTGRLNDLLQTTNQKPSTLFSLIRIATTQAPVSPDLNHTLAVLGKDAVMRRIDKQLLLLA